MAGAAKCREKKCLPTRNHLSAHQKASSTAVAHVIPTEPKAPESTRSNTHKPTEATPWPESIWHEPSSLLTICAELRNRIYEDVLLANRNIEITKALREPALLSTCRKIREETRDMWYRQNKFHTRIQDCDFRMVERWFVHAYRKEQPAPGKSNVRTPCIGEAHWKNLMSWCNYMFHADRDRPFAGETMDPGTVFCIVATASRMVWKGKFKDWKTCKEALEAVIRPLAGTINSEWLIDYEEE
ncbi:unnamed protein product [Zymoseptoria tritici ST99CH_1A5]|uniref:Uncharacterized protein n=1 Tax=Zymoseptoria tritici ST99CH_1A5 TaxID=1276529 RepID=A0A1Y6L6R9_ZYMTR|nr:unnamed protein product [Zymoseptoria tritici ST99CH_1A5]